MTTNSTNGKQIGGNLRPEIESWQGRGPCMVINDLAIHEDQDPDFHREIVTNHALHELAHILDRPELFARRSEDPNRIVFESLVLASATGREQTTSAIHGHELSFIRTAIHLVARAKLAGYDVRYTGVVRNHHYQLSPIASYVEALGDEPAKHRLIRFQDFRESEPPVEFTRLWKTDTQTKRGNA